MEKRLHRVLSIMLALMLLVAVFPQAVATRPVSAAGTISVSTPEDLRYALSTAESGTTVLLVNNITYNLTTAITVSNTITLDFNGFKITSQWETFRTSPSGKLTLVNANVQIDWWQSLIDKDNYGEVIIQSTSGTGIVSNGKLYFLQQ